MTSSLSLPKPFVRLSDYCLAQWFTLRTVTHERTRSAAQRDRTVKVRILGHTSKEIAINYGVPQGSPISPLLFLLYMSKLPKLLPNTRRSLVADDFMIYSEFSIAQSDLIQSNLQTSMDDLTLFNSDHRIILSCTKSV